MTIKTPSHPGSKLIVLGLFCGILLLWVCMGWPCLFRSITGIPCICCGMSRAWLAALQLNLADAFRHHPMFWSIPILLLLAFFDGRLFPGYLWNRILLILLPVGLLACYLIRIVVSLSGTPVF